MSLLASTAGLLVGFISGGFACGVGARSAGSRDTDLMRFVVVTERDSAPHQVPTSTVHAEIALRPHPSAAYPGAERAAVGLTPPSSLERPTGGQDDRRWPHHGDVPIVPLRGSAATNCAIGFAQILSASEPASGRRRPCDIALRRSKSSRDDLALPARPASGIKWRARTGD